MNRIKLLLLSLALVAIVASDASACTRCGRFGRLCRFSTGHIDAVAVAPYVSASPQTLVIQNNLNAPNGAAAFLAPQGNSVYGLAQAAQPYSLDPSAVLRQAAELTKGAQQLAQQGLNGYNQTASLALTLQASQPAIQAAALTAPQQLSTSRPVSQTITLSQNANGKWVVEAGTSDGGASTQPATSPPPSTPAPEIAPSAGPSLVAKHCASCHGLNIPAPKKGFYIDNGHALSAGALAIARNRVKNKEMPPGQNLDPAERAALLDEIDALWDKKPCVPQ